MEFDIYSDELAEAVYHFMEPRYDIFCEYLSDNPGIDCSLAQFVDAFLKSEFIEFLRDNNFSFTDK